MRGWLRCGVPKQGGKTGSGGDDTGRTMRCERENIFWNTDFFEHELSRTTDSYGAMTHIYSTYESRETKDGKPIDRGINSMEFFFDGERWWCVEIYWDAEAAGESDTGEVFGIGKEIETKRSNDCNDREKNGPPGASVFLVSQDN